MNVTIKVDSAEWHRQFKEGIRKTLQVNEKIFTEAVKEFEKDVKIRTPFGKPFTWKTPPSNNYVPGALRQSWKTDWQENNKVAFVYNDREYAYRVETGWSSQAPEGMMRLAVLDFPLIVERLSKKYKI